MKNNKPEDTLELYNEKQKWWVNVRDNCMATIAQFENSLKLQKELQTLANSKIIELAD